MADIPKVRFKGFSEGWEKRKLKNEFSNFIVPMRDKPKEFGGEIPWTRIEDIEGKYLNGSLSGKYVTEDTVNKMNLKIIPKDSLIVSSSATFGVVAVVTQDLVTNQTFIGLVPNEKDTLDYWYVFFHSDETRKYMKLESAGSTIFYIARESFENMSIKVPKKEEKLKIGLYFDVLDHLITLHQHKCDETKELKKYMLQKMFPKNGEKIPEIRFGGFTGDWEQRKLNEIAEKVTEKNKNNIYHEPLTNSAEMGIISQKDYFDREIVNKENLEDYYVVRNDDFVYNPRVSVTAPVGPINRNRLGRNGIMSPLYTVFRTHDIDVLYLEYYFKTTNWHRFMKLNGDSGARFDRFTIATLKFMEMPIPYPDLEEQIKIGQYFETLDHLITLHQHKCGALKEVKKFMLQNMFPQKG